MNVSPSNLTFDAMHAAYTAVLQGQTGKALRLPDGGAVFLENGEIYSTTVSQAGEVELETAGCISPIAWDDERGCWESDDSPEMSVSAVNSPVFFDFSSPGWLEFSLKGKRWAFDSDQLAEWDEDDQVFQFLVFHGLPHPDVTAVSQFIEQL